MFMYITFLLRIGFFHQEILSTSPTTGIRRSFTLVLHFMFFSVMLAKKSSHWKTKAGDEVSFKHLAKALLWKLACPFENRSEGTFKLLRRSHLRDTLYEKPTRLLLILGQSSVYQ